MIAKLEDQIRTQEEALLRTDGRALTENLRERAMPQPLWAQRPLTDSMEQVPEGVQTAVEESPADAFCVYVHIPYCRAHCGYCDCYAFPLTPSRLPELAQYSELICREIDWWGKRAPTLREKRLSTVHFGGGTPLTIGTDGLNRILNNINTFFKVNGNTELALESTSADINKNILTELRQMGFNRLHIGVQTLRDPIRKTIGRRESGSTVLEKIRIAVADGWIVSTDLIIGLPGYREEDITADVAAMADAGVEGISIYELVRSPRNRPFFAHHGILDPDVYAMWRQFQTAFWLAESYGFHHRIYNHMARGRDDNRYFTAPARNEDLLSFGTIADGWFGNYIYRHAELLDYRKGLTANGPGLLGGMRRMEREIRFARLEREVRSGCPLPDPFIELLGPENALNLFSSWLSKGYLRVCGNGESTELLPNGVWFIQKMLDDVRSLI